MQFLAAAWSSWNALGWRDCLAYLVLAWLVVIAIALIIDPGPKRNRRVRR